MAADPEIVQALSQTDLFAGLSKKHMTSVASQARLVHHQQGKDITEQGGGAAGFHLIKDGTASVTASGHERPGLGPGDYFGEISLIDGGRRSATLTAGEEGLETFAISPLTFWPLIDRHPTLTRSLMKALCARIRALDVEATATC